MSTALTSFDAFAGGDKSFLLGALEKEFSINSLLNAAKGRGFDISDADLNDQVGRLIDNSKMHMSYQDADGEIRELSIDEATMASGGAAYVVAAAAVLVVVGIAVAVSVYAGGYTQAFVYAQVYMWG